jgi:hypothetical protein
MLWDVMQCNLVDKYKCFGAIFCLNLHGVLVPIYQYAHESEKEKGKWRG